MAAKSGYDRTVTRLEAALAHLRNHAVAAAAETTIEALEMMAAEVARRVKLSIGRELHPAALAAVEAIESSRHPRLELGVQATSPAAPNLLQLAQARYDATGCACLLDEGQTLIECENCILAKLIKIMQPKPEAGS